MFVPLSLNDSLPSWPADNLLGNPGIDETDFAYDLDNDGIVNEDDPYMLAPTDQVESWNCPSLQNPNPQNFDMNCTVARKSYTGNNDWDNDGLNNWEDVDDDNDGVLDWLDIDPNCDLDDDNDLHLFNGSRFRDDGPNDIDTDIDGDGLPNDQDWDDDNDGIPDLYDPDDGNCGIVDNEEGNIYIIGGRINDTAVSPEVYFYNVGQNNWTFHSNLSVLGEGSACAIIQQANGKR